MNAEAEMKVLTGNPITITLSGRQIEVKQLTIAQTQELMKLLGDSTKAIGPDDGAFKFAFDTMVLVVSFVTGDPKDKVMEGNLAADVAAAFAAIWEQNRFSFLYQAIGKFNEAMTGKAAKQ